MVGLFQGDFCLHHAVKRDIVTIDSLASGALYADRMDFIGGSNATTGSQGSASSIALCRWSS